jgi:hypothetical protein
MLILRFSTFAGLRPENFLPEEFPDVLRCFWWVGVLIGVLAVVY